MAGQRTAQALVGILTALFSGCGAQCNGPLSLHATRYAQYIFSPDYPNEYPPNLECFWNIATPAGYVIELSIDAIGMEYPYDELMIYDGGSDSGPLLTDPPLCGCGTNIGIYRSSYRLMLVSFSSDGNNAAYTCNEQSFRFKLSYRAVVSANTSPIIPHSVTCEAGEVNRCVLCGQDWLHSGNNYQPYTACGLCPNGYVIETEVMCKAGEGNNGSSCVPCAQGWWNSGDDTQRFKACTPCPESYVTETEGATHPDNCTLLVCEAGEGNNGSSCVPCVQGWWNSGNDTQRFKACTPCPESYVTETEGATHPDNCTLLVCKAGEDNNGSSCVPCAQGWWNSGNDTQRFEACTPCPEGYVTETEGATHPDNCTLFVCKAGECNNGSYCVPCAQGWWNSGNDTQRFEACTPCPESYVTETEGATHPDNCTLRDCPTGTYIDVDEGEVCTLCAIGSYQTERRKYNCTTCPEGSSTENPGSAQLKSCTALPGVETSVTMTMTYKLVVICTDEQAQIVSASIQTRVVALKDDWPDLCTDSTCSNADVTASCGSDANAVVAVLSMKELPAVVSETSSDVIMTPENILQLSAESTFDLQSIGAAFQTASVSKRVTCPDGSLMSGGACAASGPIQEHQPSNESSSSKWSPVLVGSVVGGIVGVVAIVLLVAAIVRTVRKGTPVPYEIYEKANTQQEYNSLEMVQPHPHDSEMIHTRHGPISSSASRHFAFGDDSEEYDYILEEQGRSQGYRNLGAAAVASSTSDAVTRDLPRSKTGADVIAQRTDYGSSNDDKVARDSSSNKVPPSDAKATSEMTHALKLRAEEYDREVFESSIIPDDDDAVPHPSTHETRPELSLPTSATDEFKLAIVKRHIKSTAIPGSQQRQQADDTVYIPPTDYD